MKAGTKQVVVTGLGVMTPLGGDVVSTWSAMLAGKSGVRRLDSAWAQEAPVKIAAPVAIDIESVTGGQERRRTDRSGQLALAAARQAWRDAGSPKVRQDRLAVAIGAAVGNVGSVVEAHERIRDRGWRRLSPFTIPKFMPNGAAAILGIELGAGAGCNAPCSGCASGAEAIGYAADVIRAGRADVVVAGGSDAGILPLNVAAFASMGALSLRNDDPERAFRPFDRSGDGFVLGEGAGVLVLESGEHAARRGAIVHAVVAGVGYAADPRGPATAGADAVSLAAAIRAALADSGASAEQVVHVNANGTAIPAVDAAEMQALHTALGPAARNVSVSATKSMTGHLLGGAGAVESIAAICALQSATAPPTLNLEDPCEGLRAGGVRICAEPLELPRITGTPVALNISSGFGSQCVALAFMGSPV